MTKKHKFHVPLKALLLYVLLISVMVMGVTFSKYVTVSYSGDAARVARFGDLYITENGEAYEANKDYKVVPGVNLTRDIVLHFEKSEVACYVFFQVDAESFTKNGKNYIYGSGENSISFRVTELGTRWSSFDLEDGKTIYYTVVEPNESISQPIIANRGAIIVNKALSIEALEKPDISIKVKATAVQYGGFTDAKAAYSAIK